MKREWTGDDLRFTGYVEFVGTNDIGPRWADCPGAFSWRRPHTEKEIVAAYGEDWPAPIEPARCECHEKMGNDFYFLPVRSCFRRDGKCTLGPNKGF